MKLSQHKAYILSQVLHVFSKNQQQMSALIQNLKSQNHTICMEFNQTLLTVLKMHIIRL